MIVENPVEPSDVVIGKVDVMVVSGVMLLALPPNVNTPRNGTPTVAVKLAVMGTPEPLAAPNVGVTVVVNGTTVTTGSAVARVRIGWPSEPVEVITPLKEDVIVVVEPPEPVVVIVVSALRWCQSPAAPAEERGGGKGGPRQRTAIAISSRGPDGSREGSGCDVLWRMKRAARMNVRVCIMMQIGEDSGGPKEYSRWR